MTQEWHALKTDQLMDTLRTSRRGLSGEEARRRLEEYGPNELAERGKVSALRIFLVQFKDIFVIMLLAAIVFSVIVGYYESQTTPGPHGLIEDYADAIAIGAIVVLNAVVGFVQEYRSERAMEAMRKLTAPKASLMRDGGEVVVPAREVVPGDVVLLESGDRIPADGRLVEIVNLRTDEAVLTGESIPVEKGTGVVEAGTPLTDRRNMVFMATHTIYGRGKAVVTSTGMNTEFGKIAEMVQTVEKEETPLKLRLSRFAKKLGMFVTVVCAVILLLEAFAGEPLPESFMTAVALAVSAVPEGLPAIVTVALALGARDLARRNSIIRRLSSAETLGSTTIICSDKTGTLTKGEMTVRKVYADDRIIEVTGVGYEPAGEFYQGGAAIRPEEDAHLALLLRIGALCNNARLVKEEVWRVMGDSTEGALVVAAAKAGMRQEEEEGRYVRIGEVPFSSERKLMTTVHSVAGDGRFAYVKGALEIVLERCTRILEDGKAKELTERKRREILEVNAKLASEALRILAMANRTLPETLEDFTEESVENNLVFVGLVGMIDPPREEVREANRLCERAGIKTVMITGDHKLTAMAVAKEIGMLKEGSLALTGVELDEISDEEFERVVEDVAVYARVSPEHKIRIVGALKKKGHIVAMTGDGVNDAPALKNADIGVAMGITGTDVTREAADMVLADDNFATIVEAVRGGRIIYDNIRKFAFFLMRSNFDELLVITSFALARLPLPLLPAMILWINLATDGGPALALSTDPPTEDVMQRPPRDPKEGILHGRLASVIVSFLTQSIGTAFVFGWTYFVAGATLEKARTMAFMQACMRELVVVWNCRSEKRNAFRVGFFSNRFLLAAVFMSGLLTASLCYVPVLQLMFRTVQLGVYDWVLVLSVACSGLLILPEVLAGRKVWRWM